MERGENMENKQPHNGTKAQPPHWYVLTTLDPRQAESRLSEVHLLPDSTPNEQGHFQFFIPYMFLKLRHAPSTGLAGHSTLPHGKSRVEANNETRSILRRYIFIRAHESELVEYLSGEWNQWSRNRIQFYLDSQRNKVTVSDRMMGKFIEACSDMRLRFEVLPPVKGLVEGEEVILNTTAFRGEKARILSIEHTPRGIRLSLGLQLFSGSMVIRLSGVSEGDILREGQQQSPIDSSHLIDNTQRRLLAILSRRVNGKQTTEVLEKDRETLLELFNYRFHHFENDTARRHFLALMLICARLLRDEMGQAELTEVAVVEVAAIEARAASKAATDVRAYLHVALYLATGQPGYRETAKEYVREHQPKSQALRRFVKLIRVKRV